jgi:hypothetical protein
MTSPRDFWPRREWLLAIGQGLRAEYAGVEQPTPKGLTALIKQLEEPPHADADSA